MTQIRLEYDDQAIEMLDKINAALHAHATSQRQATCLQLVDDDQEHDGFIILDVKERDTSDPPEHY